jgi:hypothetical protein
MTDRTTLLAPLLTTAALLAGSLAAAAPSAHAQVEDRAAARTTLTFAVDDCEGCEVQLVNARSTLDATRRTWGLSVTVRAPWEGHTGYLTTVAWRYSGEGVGDTVTLEEAVTKRKASACWEGVRSREVTVPLVVEKVRVRGVKGKVDGSIAFVPTTQGWLPPMREVWDGVLGSQDVNVCR